MITAITLTLTLALALPAGAQDADPPAPKSRALEILEQADAATKAVRTARYDGRWYGTGAAAGTSPYVEAAVVTSKEADGSMAADGTFYQPPAEGGEASGGGFRVVVMDGAATVIDHTRKAVLRANARTSLAAVYMVEYAHPAPFSDEINGELQEHEGRTMVNGVLCDVVFVEYGDVAPGVQARWYFGAEDHLPRRVERLGANGDRAGARVLDIANLEVNVELPADAFHEKVPEGYSRLRTAPGPGLGPGTGAGGG